MTNPESSYDYIIEEIRLQVFLKVIFNPIITCLK